MDLFDMNMESYAPLADRMRPKTLDDFVGQEHLIGKGKILRKAIENDKVTNCIFFGPPGCGKTTLASIIEKNTEAKFFRLNAVTAGVADVRKIIEEATNSLKMYHRRSYLLLDECHRWNKAQSDSILPSVEKGIITLIGSTTENPMISMTSAIVSRCRIFEFFPLSVSDIEKAVRRALTDSANGFGDLDIEIDENALKQLCIMSNGDIRCALNGLELAVVAEKPDKNGIIKINEDIISQSIQKKAIQCDEDQYYDMISAFIKSMRGSDANAALYWFGVMINAGVDPRLLARRIMIHASEDVGLADPMALVQATSAMTALEKIGLPEARIPMAQAIIYICKAKKSNSVVTALDAAFSDAEKGGVPIVPNHLKECSFRGAKELGYGEGYKYPHNYEGHVVEQNYMPKGMEGRIYYRPSGMGDDV
ncbi:MAG: replication-associated recombination protein A [Clostridia bacterium]|nr:replication-associated recombination protein A [Clostridia bacterium]